MGNGRITRGGCAARLATAATFVLLAASMSEAQTATREDKQEEAIVNEPHTSSCTGETPLVNGRREIRNRTQDNKNNVRVERRVNEWAKGKPVGSNNEYNWNRDFRFEERTTERTFTSRFRHRTRLICHGECMPQPGLGDDEFFSEAFRCETRNGQPQQCEVEPPVFECK